VRLRRRASRQQRLLGQNRCATEKLWSAAGSGRGPAGAVWTATIIAATSAIVSNAFMSASITTRGKHFCSPRNLKAVWRASCVKWFT
jgi:hypothetical protein